MRSNTYTQSTNNACAVPPSRLETLADCAREPAQPPSPYLDGRKSATSTARANMCASIGVTGYRSSATCPHRRAIALPLSRRLCARAGTAPITVSRWSKICPIVRPRQHMCKRRCARIPKLGKLPAPSRHCSELDYTCAPVRVASSGLTLPPRAPTVHLRHATRRGREIRGSKNRLCDARHACTCTMSRVGRQLCAGPGRLIPG